MDDDITMPLGPDDEPTLPLGPTGGSPADEDIGSVIGPYRLVRRIGQGGMGEVFEAEQTEPMRRRVALKVIKQGMDTRTVIARFDAERQALALMDHPCIAKVYDAGATERGRPFFVMEYVDGAPITEYCNRHRLGTAERLRLFVQVCEGVQHAHQKAIIHRDLKPGNILVTEVDGRPVPKIIDFGLAKATTQRLTELTMFTELGQMLGTPEYMSPEQAAFADDDIDTRTDVYALGVVLYVLLAGAMPFDSQELRKAGYEAICRIIREQDPPRPSTRVGSLGERASTVAEARGVAPRRLRSELQGDLDWITMKALEKDRARRYETANAFAMDVRRFLDHEPVLASPPGAGYRLGKLVRRNRGAFAALGAIAGVLVAATVVSSVMYVRAERASEVAVREAVRSGQVSRFLGDMLGGVGPQVAQGRDTQMLRAILDETAGRLGRELAEQPDVEATLRLQLGDIYRQLGEFDAAQEQVDRAGALQAAHALESPSAFLVQQHVGSIAWAREDLPRAAEAFARARGLMSAAAIPDSTLFAETTVDLANVLAEQAAYAEADSLLQQALVVYRALPRAAEGLAVALNSHGNLLRYLGNPVAAEEPYREALAMHRRLLGDDHPFVATDLHNLGGLLNGMGRRPEGEEMLREALATQRRLYAGPHPEIAGTLKVLARMALDDHRCAEADSLAGAAYDIAVSYFGAASEPAQSCRLLQADARQQGGAVDEAEATFAEVVAVARGPGCDEPTLLPDALYHQASARLDQGRARDALAPFAEALERSTAIRGEDGPNTLLIRNDYARALIHLGEDEAAVVQLRAVLAARERVLGAQHPQTAITCLDLGRGLWRLGKFEEAAQLLRRSRDDFAAAMGENHRGRWNITQNLAGALRDLGRCDEAETELQGALEYWRSQGPDADAFYRLTRVRLSTVLLRSGRAADADRALAAALADSGNGIDPWLRGMAYADRGETLLNMGQPADAERSLRDSYEALAAARGVADQDTQKVIRLLVRSCESLGRSADAAGWRARLL